MHTHMAPCEYVLPSNTHTYTLTHTHTHVSLFFSFLFRSLEEIVWSFAKSGISEPKLFLTLFPLIMILSEKESRFSKATCPAENKEKKRNGIKIGIKIKVT